MSEIVRVPQSVSGARDSVELMASCVINELEKCEDGSIGFKAAPQVYPCKLLASYENGIMTLSAREYGIIISVRIDETFALLRAAADAAKESGDTDDASCSSPQR